MAIVVPALIGIGLLAGGLMLLPGQLEILHAARRARPVTTMAVPTPAAMSVPVERPPTHPSIAAAIPTADAPALAALTARLIAAGETVSTVQVAYDLVAAGRPAVALAYLVARPDGASTATWRLRVDLLRAGGRQAAAVALVDKAAQGRSGVAAADLIAAAYAIDRADLIVLAAARGAIPAPDAALALDLARRAEAAGRFDLIAMLDRATRADWRAGDPWLAIRVAAHDGDVAAGLRAADRLPADQRESAREAILTKAGDRVALRALLMTRAAAAGANLSMVAEQLLAAGYRDESITVLKQAAEGQPVAAPATQRLLYLMGPRPAADDLVWLRQRATQGEAAEQVGWLTLYAERDRPATALTFLSTHPLATRTEVLLVRLSLAAAAGDDAGGRAVLAGLLDGRVLSAVQVRALSAAAPRRIDPAQAGALARLRVATGVAGSRDRLDLAWTAWNGGDAGAAERWLREYLAVVPTDAPALRLMADVRARTGGERAARPWLERALAQTPADGRARAELLDRLGRGAEAEAVVERLREAAPADRGLAALHARLLIAQGQPGRARMVLAP